VAVLARIEKRRAAAVASLVLALAVCALRIALHRSGSTSERLMMGLDTRADGLLIGSAIAFFLSDDCPFLDRPWAPALMRGLGLAGAAVTLGSVALVHKEAPYAIVFGYTVVSLAVGAMVLSLVTFPVKIMARIFALSPFVYIGRISYGVYLWHWVILTTFGAAGVFDIHGVKGYAVRLACIALGFAVAAASFRFVEEPFLRLKSRFGKT
jgi:peptidoglycan/LPS O-acetylase OafA/YrhL